MENLYKSLSEALTDLGWYHVDNFEMNSKEIIDFISDILNLHNIDETGKPEIVTKNKTIIVTDNHDFNETYLIDLVSKVLKEKQFVPGTYDLVYIDNVTLRLYIDNPKYVKVLNYNEQEFKNIEREQLLPSVIVINPDANEVVSVSEMTIAQITEDNVKYLLNYLDDDFCKNEQIKEMKEDSEKMNAVQKYCQSSENCEHCTCGNNHCENEL